MGPVRKKSRTEPPSVDKGVKAPSGASASKATTPADFTTDGQTSIEAPADDGSPSVKSSESPAGSIKKIKNKSSWYGSWPRKSTASTSVARKTVLADKATNASSADLRRFEPPKKTPQATPSRPPFMNVGKSRETIDVSMGATLEEEDTEDESNARPEVGNNQDVLQDVPQEDSAMADPPETVVESIAEGCNDASLDTKPLQPATSSGWFGGWLSRPPVQASEKSPESTLNDKVANIASTFEEQPKHLEEHPKSIESPVAVPKDPKKEDGKLIEGPKAASSWFGFWSTPTSSSVGEAPMGQLPVKVADDVVMSDAPSVEEPVQEALPVVPASGSSWAFWSTEPTKKMKETVKQLEEGQLAVAGEESQNHPAPAKTATVKDNKKGKAVKRVRPVSVDIDDIGQSATSSKSPTPKTPMASSNMPLKPSPPNLLIPSVRSTYKLAASPGILQQIARLILHSQQRPAKHVFLVQEPPKIKKALAIGIHGLFPAAILRTVIGQPTGTSVRFANHAAEAIRRWTDKNGSLDCEIEKVALEGEGRIGERVDNLWKLLLNWIDHVRQADFILIACHSQGVPVAIMLIAKLIEFGVVSTGRMGVCAMAGVSLGPFADYKSKLFSGSAGELFEFANPESNVSKRYEDSLRVAMHYGVRVMYCGSIDDQLVSMESAIFAPASHPYIYRSVFVDGRIHAPDFLSHLVGFALKLRNLGVPDHGLIRELSAPLAGSLYTGEGHSRLYDDGRVYDLAIEFALETTSVGDVPLTLKKYEIATNSNPYLLPWIMRGLLEEDFVRTALDQETTELLKQFDDWKPATKVLKDVKYRLEAVRSKL